MRDDSTSFFAPLLLFSITQVELIRADLNGGGTPYFTHIRADWLASLADSELNWLRALVGSPSIVQGSSHISNPIHRLFAPRPHEKVVVGLSNGQPTSIVAYGGARSYGVYDPEFKAVEVLYDSSTNLIDITIFEERR